MRKMHRGIREARGILQSARVKRAPVDVYKIARLHADVIEQEMPDSISGMLIPAPAASGEKQWTIIVNADHAEVRRRFTVAHELGHLLLHNFDSPHADTGFKIRFRANVEYDGSVAEEIEANQFAAELLMPSHVLLKRTAELEMEYASDEAASEKSIDALAREFKVSKQALQIRLSDFI